MVTNLQTRKLIMLLKIFFFFGQRSLVRNKTQIALASMMLNKRRTKTGIFFNFSYVSTCIFKSDDYLENLKYQ